MDDITRTDDVLFSYFLNNENYITSNILPKKIRFGKYYINLSEKTQFSTSSNNGNRIGIIGLCVDSRGELKSLAEFLVNKSRSVEEVIENEKRLAGKYVLLYMESNNLYVLGDATCSLQVYYSQNSKFAISSSQRLISQFCNLKYSEESITIRKMSDVSQAMPGNISLYENILQLLPSEYYDASKRKSIKLNYSKYQINGLSIKDAVKKSVNLIDNISKAYVSQYDISCPLTAGKDSRVVLAFLRKNATQFNIYTMKHKKHSGKEDDLVLPPTIAKSIGQTYEQIEDIPLPNNIIKELDEYFGVGMYSTNTAMLAYTIKTNYSTKAIINGDIIGQIGKSSLHRNLFDIWATPSYFMCKLHNYCKLSKNYIYGWMKSNEKSRKYISIFDLFSWDSRLGRWAAQENAIYDFIGIPYLNIFNCRDVIFSWVQVDRSRRMKSALHEEIIKAVDSSLLNFPFGKEPSILFSIAKSNRIIFFVSSFIKYYIERYIFLKNYYKE